jgi:hypothetical protein
VYRSPNRSKTIVRPSGETSSEIHDPLLVVKLAVRAAASGRSFFFAVSRVDAAEAGVWATASVGNAATNATKSPSVGIRRECMCG